jgi:ubiquinone biosynthesis accessory factor UbiJ
MTHTSPISFVQSLFQSAADRLQPPQWLVDEGQQRLVLLLNHVLMQEPEAQARLARKKGSVIQVRWGAFSISLQLTPAGLVNVADVSRSPDLVLSLEGQPPWAVARQVLQGQRPPVQIEGDVQLAAELAWLSDNLRWDLEEDLARLLGDIPAHALADAGRKLVAALRPWLAKVLPASGAAAPATVSAFRAGA